MIGLNIDIQERPGWWWELYFNSLFVQNHLELKCQYR